MKLILKTEVDNLGLAGDVVDVADGYGRNYLVPRGMALMATKGAMKEAAALVRSRKAHEASTLGDAEAMKATLEARPLRIEVRVDDRGHLYGSVGVTEVHRVLRDRGHNIEKKRIELKAVKEIGIYEVPVQVHPQVHATVSIDIVDVEGVVTLESLAADRKGPVAAPIELDEDGNPVIVEGVEGDEVIATDDVEALAQQALEAARAFEAEQSATEEEAPEAPTEDVAAEA
ncbi:MAG: large subunit ribosomal protein L9 [Nitriliruptoraceae bacterium]|jgi:large subunit ribosomal protein L9